MKRAHASYSRVIIALMVCLFPEAFNRCSAELEEITTIMSTCNMSNSRMYYVGFRAFKIFDELEAACTGSKDMLQQDYDGCVTLMAVLNDARLEFIQFMTAYKINSYLQLI